MTPPPAYTDPSHAKAAILQAIRKPLHLILGTNASRIKAGLKPRRIRNRKEK